jgi:hypothetical protein
MHALTAMTTAHPFACAWIASAFVIWFAIYARTGGFRRRKESAPSHQVWPGLSR